MDCGAEDGGAITVMFRSIDPVTANLTSQGLQRTLPMGSYRHRQVLGNENVTAICALEPMTHLQTANQFPDLVPLEAIQQFAMLNSVMLDESPSGPVLHELVEILPSGEGYGL